MLMSLCSVSPVEAGARAGDLSQDEDEDISETETQEQDDDVHSDSPTEPRMIIPRTRDRADTSESVEIIGDVYAPLKAAASDAH